MGYKINGRSLIMASGKDIDFGRRILRTLDAGDIVVVILDPHDGGRMPENVFGVDDAGSVVWQVPCLSFPTASEYPYYLGGVWGPQGILLYNVVGVEALVDPATGRITWTQFCK